MPMDESPVLSRIEFSFSLIKLLAIEQTFEAKLMRVWQIETVSCASVTLSFLNLDRRKIWNNFMRLTWYHNYLIHADKFFDIL